MRFKGMVKKFTGRGRDLGFPTANIEINDLDLEDGLYLAKAWIGKEEHKALAFIGMNKTFNETDRRAEIYILDFNEYIYSHELEVETIKKIRDVIKFETPEKLIEQMKKDELIAREFFSKYNKIN
jgi:riboflavin kinase / FMN adenylyltransferase